MNTKPVLGQTKEKRKFLFWPQYLRSPNGKWGWQWLRLRTIQFEYRSYRLLIKDGPRGFHPMVQGWLPVAWVA
jgi:hypothetical protein